MRLNRKLTVGALTLGVLFVIAGWRALDLRRSRADALSAADARAQNLTHILAEYLSGAFAGGDAALRQLAVHSERIGGVGADRAEWTSSLIQARAGLVGIGAISVIDTRSVIRHSTLERIVGERRDDLIIGRVLAQPGDEELHIGVPVQAVVPPFGYIIPIGRPLRSKDGTVEGAVVASFIADNLRQFLRTVAVGTFGSVWIFHPSGLVLLREPSSEDTMGEAAAGNPLFEAAMAGAAVFRGTVAANGRVQRAALERITRAPLTVVVALDEAETLAPWQREVLLTIGTVIGVALVFGAVLTRLFRQMDLAAAAERSLAEARTAEAQRLRDAHEQLEAAYARAQAARASAERASALKDEFLMTVSHELRTPLGVILTGAHLLGSDRLPARQRASTIDAIARNARAQARLVDDLLDVSNGMAGTLRLEFGPVVVERLIRNALDTVAGAAEAKGVAIDVHIDGEVGAIIADAARLQQVLWNLLSNAVKFTPTGGEVRVRATRADSTISLSVEDTGIGIASDFLPHVFDRFRQEHTGETRRYGGLGLGLAIARHLVELHGGEIAAESEGQGRGTRFTVHLPTVAAPAPDRPRRGEPEPDDPLGVTGETRRRAATG